MSNLGRKGLVAHYAREGEAESVMVCERIKVFLRCIGVGYWFPAVVTDDHRNLLLPECRHIFRYRKGKSFSFTLKI